MIIQTPNCLAAAENDLAVGLYHLHVNFRKYIVLQSNSVWSIENKNYFSPIWEKYVCNRNIWTVDGAIVVKIIYILRSLYFSVIVNTQL